MDTKTPTPIANFLSQKYGVSSSAPELSEHKKKLIDFVSLLIEIDQKLKKKEVMKNETRI